MSNPPGYPLPDGELGDDDLVCQLVYLPDRPEYWQAFLGALSYMTTWRAWERDTDKRGKDAAANWREAFEHTMECWRMTCLDDLKADVAAILAIMEKPQSCCDEIDVTDGDRYTDRVEDGVGNVPQNIIDAGYATGVSDWAGFDDYKCMISHVIVDQLEVRLDELAPIVDSAGLVFGGLAALAAIVSVIFSAGGTALAFGMLATTGSVALLYSALFEGSLLATLANKVATNHDDLACAVYNSDGDAAALSALNDEIDTLFTAPEALILKNMNLGPTLKALYAGRYDQQDIAEILDDAGYDVGDFTCDCAQVGEYLVTFTFDGPSWENWQKTNGYLSGTHGNPVPGIYADYNTGFLWVAINGLLAKAGLSLSSPGDYVLINRIIYDYKMDNANVGTLYLDQNSGSRTWGEANVTSWTSAQKIDSPGYQVTHGNTCLRFRTINGTTNRWDIDNIMFDFDVYRA